VDESERPYPVLSSRAIIISGALLIVLGVGLAVLLMVTLGDGNHANQLDAIKTAGTIVVGTGGAAALWLTAPRQRTNEIALNQKHVDQQTAERTYQHTAFDAEARRITDLYGKAVEQLGSNKPAVRLAGFYALERLAQDNVGQRQTIVNVLCAYLRMPSGEDPEEYEVRQTVQRILSAHLRADEKYWNVELDLSGAKLSKASFEGCLLHVAIFTGATFEGRTSFNGAHFGLTVPFARTRFTDYTTFDGAQFSGDADFTGATFAGVTWFRNARFYGFTTFTEAVFERESGFTSSIFGPTVFGFATFTGLTVFTRCRFVGGVASWLGTSFGTPAQFHLATFTGPTYFPENIDLTDASFAEEAGICTPEEPDSTGPGASFTLPDGSTVVIEVSGRPYLTSGQTFVWEPGLEIISGDESVPLPIIPPTWDECVENARATLTDRLGRDSDPATEATLPTRPLPHPVDWGIRWFSGWFVEALDGLAAPADVEQLAARGAILADLGYATLAIANLDLVIAAVPNHAAALSARAYAHGVLGHSDDSQRDFAAALEAAPNNAWTYFRRARLTGDLTDFHTSLQANEPPLTQLQITKARSMTGT
jgi:uncharacterized protein YjbI with pentapeptide repeats